MTPREELEARLTALLLGELPADEAAALRQIIAQDTELARLHDRLKQTIGLVRETFAAPEHEAAAVTDTPKLSTERREKLVATFKVSRPKVRKQSRWRNGKWRKVKWQEFAALAAMVVGLLAVAATFVTHSERETIASLSDGESSLSWFFSGVERSPQRTTSIPGRGMASIDAESFRAQAQRPLPAVRQAEAAGRGDSKVPASLYGGPQNGAGLKLPAGGMPTTPGNRQIVTVARAPEAEVRQSLERSPRHFAEIALPSLGDAVQSGSEGVSDGRDKQSVGGQSPIAQSDFFQRGDGDFGRERATLARAGGMGGGGAGLADRDGSRSTVAIDEPASGTSADKKPLSRPAENATSINAWSVNASDSGLVAKEIGGGVVFTAPAPGIPMPDTAAKNYDARFGDSNKKLPVPVERRGGVAGAAVAETMPQDGLAFRSFNAQQTPQPLFGNGLNQGLGRPANKPESKANKPALVGDPMAFDVLSQEAVGYINGSESRLKALEAKQDKNGERANLSYRWRNNGSPIADGKDRAIEGKKLAELSKREYVPGNSVTETDQSGSKSERDSGRALGEKPQLADRIGEEPTLSKSRVEIALPQGERIEAFEKLRIASGPVVNSEISTGLPEPEEAYVARRAAGSPRPLKQNAAQTAEPETLLKPEGERIETAVEYQRLLATYQAMTNSTRDELKKGLAAASPDPALSRLLDDLSLTEQKIALLTNTLPVDHPDAKGYRDVLTVLNRQLDDRVDGVLKGIQVRLKGQKARLDTIDNEIASAEKKESEVTPKLRASVSLVPQPEVLAAENAFSTFSLNVSDVSFKLAAASLEKGQMPDPATVRSEEFINAFDYRDPEPKGSAPIAFAWERARYPFAHDRDLLRFSVKTAASGRQPGRPLNLVLLLDNSGSMERADRVRIIQECLRVLAGQLQSQDRVSVVAFARTPRLWVDGLPGNQAGELPQRVGGLTPQGGTNLEDAMNLAYQTALRHYLANGVNRVVLLTDGAANLGDVQPESLKKKVETHRQQGIALDCFGIGWEGFNDELLETLSRNGDGRYGFVNTPEAATSEFAGQLAGALKVAASDVKVQVEFNPRRTTAYRQIGYAKHQLKKEQFRDNTVDAAEIGAAEAGNALYVVQVNPAGEGPIGIVRVRFKVPGTSDYREHEWPVPYEGAARSLEQSSASLRLAASASAFSEWLVSSSYAGEVTPDKLLGYLNGVPEASSADPRPRKLEWMIRQAKSVAGK